MHTLPGFVAAAYLTLTQAVADEPGAEPRTSLRTRCDDGKAEACFDLAMAYLAPADGVARDPVNAAEKLEKRACDGKDAEACHRLGTMYLEGLDVPRDDVWAALFLQRACSGKSARACERLETLGRKYDGEVAIIESDFASPCASPGNPCQYDRLPKVKKMPPPTYSRGPRDPKIEGTVILEILIGSSGRVLRANILRSVPGLDEAALEAVREWIFEPALKDGRAVATLVQAPITFKIY